MRPAPRAARGFFPLDEELALLPGERTPSRVEGLARLSTGMPFSPAAQMLGHFTRVSVSEPTARRRTEQAGAAYVRVQTATVEALEHGREQTTLGGPELQQVSVDGAMVPLVQREWAEVKTLAIGTVGERVWEDEEGRVPTPDLSSFSRLADQQTFGRLATVETERRGGETAGKVVGVVDGAEGEQQFLDLHRPDAVRILDWGHAAEHLVEAGQALGGRGTRAVSEWLGVQLHELKHGDPQTVLAELRSRRDHLVERADDAGTAGEVVVATLAYLEKRQEQICYAAFQAQGYPIGSGAVESANKLLVEARLKGAGMPWAREHVNPLVALRTIVCSDRWEEAWPQIAARLRQDAREDRRHRRAARQQARMAATTVSVPVALVDRPSVVPDTPTPTPDQPTDPETNPTARPWRPAANHPWRRSLHPGHRSP